MTNSPPADDRPIFHLAVPDEWADAFRTGEYRRSTRGMTLEDVGFIHCSARDQIEATAGRFYGDLVELVILTVDPALVPSQIVYEPPAADVEELFPHIYGPLPVSAVNHATFWIRQPDTPWALDD